MEKQHVSAAVVRRLPRYLRYLNDLSRREIVRISSEELSRRMALTASQIRQDFNCFGGYGQQGYGYNVDHLRQEIAAILGLPNQKKTILVGAGNLGHAILNHIDFSRHGFKLTDIYDNNPALVGTSLVGVTVHHIDDLEQRVAADLPDMAIITVPRAAATDVVDRLHTCGVKAFWNFSSLDIRYDDSLVESVHLGDSLMTLRYHLEQR